MTFLNKFRIFKVAVQKYIMALIKVFEGSEIMAMPVKQRLEQAGINPVIKNNIQSATVVGFGTLGLAMELYVEDTQAQAAFAIVAQFK